MQSREEKPTIEEIDQENLRLEDLDQEENILILQFSHNLVQAVSEHKKGDINIPLKKRRLDYFNARQIFGRDNFEVGSDSLIIFSNKVYIFKPFVNYLKTPLAIDIISKLPYMREYFHSKKHRENAEKIKADFNKSLATLDFRKPAAYDLKSGEELFFSKHYFQIIPEIEKLDFFAALKNKKTNEYIYINSINSVYRLHIISNDLKEKMIPVTNWSGAMCGDQYDFTLDEKSGYKTLYWVNPKPFHKHPNIKGPSYFETENGEKIPLEDFDTTPIKKSMNIDIFDPVKINITAIHSDIKEDEKDENKKSISKLKLNLNALDYIKTDNLITDNYSATAICIYLHRHLQHYKFNIVEAMLHGNELVVKLENDLIPARLLKFPMYSSVRDITRHLNTEIVFSIIRLRLSHIFQVDLDIDYCRGNAFYLRSRNYDLSQLFDYTHDNKIYFSRDSYLEIFISLITHNENDRERIKDIIADIFYSDLKACDVAGKSDQMIIAELDEVNIQPLVQPPLNIYYYGLDKIVHSKFFTNKNIPIDTKNATYHSDAVITSSKNLEFIEDFEMPSFRLIITTEDKDLRNLKKIDGNYPINPKNLLFILFSENTNIPNPLVSIIFDYLSSYLNTYIAFNSIAKASTVVPSSKTDSHKFEFEAYRKIKLIENKNFDATPKGKCLKMIFDLLNTRIMYDNADEHHVYLNSILKIVQENIPRYETKYHFKCFSRYQKNRFLNLLKDLEKEILFFISKDFSKNLSVKSSKNI